MKAFTQLLLELEATAGPAERKAVLERFFRRTPPEDAAWALYFLTGRRLACGVTRAQLRRWVLEETRLPAWLVEECSAAVGDAAETWALLLPPAETSSAGLPLHQVVAERLLPLSSLAEGGRLELVRRTWRDLDHEQRFIFHRMLTGGFRAAVTPQLVARALAQVSGLPAEVLAYRLLVRRPATAANYRRLLDREGADLHYAQPYPFCLASPLEAAPDALGPIGDWQAEWQWDAVRVQLIRRQDQVLLWTEAEAWVTGAFPELVAAAQALPNGTVLDGQILAWEGPAGGPFDPSASPHEGAERPAQRRRAAPLVFVASDLLEDEGQDVRHWPLTQRRARLKGLLARAQTAAARPAARPPSPRLTQGDLFVGPGSSPQPAAPQPLALRLAAGLEAASWAELSALVRHARASGAEGVVLKRRSAPYAAGRAQGDWWRWTSEPHHLAVVLMYAHAGQGARSGLFTDCTFGVWHAGSLAPIVRAPAELTQAEVTELEAFVREHTISKHGPVRRVEPKLVFELIFEGARRCGRRRSGVALRQARIVRWCRDRPATEADSLGKVLALTGDYGAGERTR